MVGSLFQQKPHLKLTPPRWPQAPTGTDFIWLTSQNQLIRLITDSRRLQSPNNPALDNDQHKERKDKNTEEERKTNDLVLKQLANTQKEKYSMFDEKIKQPALHVIFTLLKKKKFFASHLCRYVDIYQKVMRLPSYKKNWGNS